MPSMLSGRSTSIQAHGEISVRPRPGQYIVEFIFFKTKLLDMLGLDIYFAVTFARGNDNILR